MHDNYNQETCTPKSLCTNHLQHTYVHIRSTMAGSAIIMILMQTLKLSELFPVLNSSIVTEPSLSLMVTFGELNSTVTIIGTKVKKHNCNV